tara:strand:+ start:6881 stop:7195 length:315 start_codon:yes stop_codon:yes gene_type:complete
MNRESVRQMANFVELTKSPHMVDAALSMQERVDTFNDTLAASDKATDAAEKVRLLENAKAQLRDLKLSQSKGISLADLSAVEGSVGMLEASYRAAGYYIGRASL